MKYHIAAAISMLFVSAGCFPKKQPATGMIQPLDPKLMGALASMGKPGEAEKRSGDEIVVCGKFYHTGTPVVTWMDPGGYDAYRTERRFSPWEKASFSATTQAAKKDPADNDITSPNRYGIRFVPASQPASEPTTADSSHQPTRLTAAEFEMIRGGGWTLPLLQEKIDQFVLHYDVAGTSHTCFKVLQDSRDLSVTFMCDIDGTIYQTLDCKERAWQATKANDRSIGIEIANMGAYPPNSKDNALTTWYRKDSAGRTTIVLPPYVHSNWIRTPNFVGHPDRNEPVVGEINTPPGKSPHIYEMYDLTPQQYVALEHLTATLCTVFPKIKCDYPKDEKGQVIPHKLPDEVYDNYEGVLGHYHVQSNKQDPGPALNWDKIIDGARALMTK